MTEVFTTAHLPEPITIESIRDALAEVQALNDDYDAQLLKDAPRIFNHFGLAGKTLIDWKIAVASGTASDMERKHLPELQTICSDLFTRVERIEALRSKEQSK